MKFKAAVKYQMYSVKKPLIILYIVIYCILILMTILQTARPGNVYFSGLEMASLIFIFVVGICSFKEPFHMMLVNGVSRQTFFKSISVMILLVAFGMALVDSINSLVFSAFTDYRSLFTEIYRPGFITGSKEVEALFQVTLDGFLWRAFIYAAVAMIGYFITTLFYRMNKALKLLVSIGVPVLIFVVLPIVDNFLITDVYLLGAIERFFIMSWGLADGANPYISMISSVLTFAVFGGLSFLTMKRATVKKS